MLCSAQGKGPLSGLPGHCTKQGCPRLGVEDIQSQPKAGPHCPSLLPGEVHQVQGAQDRSTKQLLSPDSSSLVLCHGTMLCPLMGDGLLLFLLVPVQTSAQEGKGVLHFLTWPQFPHP